MPTREREIDQAGIDLVKSFESLSLTAYVCPAGKLTIGWGHIRGVQAGDKITEAEAEALLLADLRATEHAVAKAVHVQLSDDQFAALVVFTFNVGEAALLSSDLLVELNAGHYYAVPSELARWNKFHDHGVLRVSSGLTRRRHAEADLWLKGGAAIAALSMPQEVRAA